jgi:hypothetical protein
MLTHSHSHIHFYTLYSVSSLVSHLKSTDEWDNTVVVFIGDNKHSDTAAGQRRSHPFAKEEGGRGRDGYFEGAVRVPAFISGGFVETSLLAADTAPYRYVYSTQCIPLFSILHCNVSIYVNKFPHISLIKITNMYIVSETHFTFIQGRVRRCMSPICMQPFSTFLLLHKAVLEMDSLLLLSRQLLILQVPVLRLTYTMKALLSVLAWTNGGT